MDGRKQWEDYEYIECLDGEVINIEMQRADEKNMVKRSLYYWSKIFSAEYKGKGRYRVKNNNTDHTNSFKQIKHSQRFLKIPHRFFRFFHTCSP